MRADRTILFPVAFCLIAIFWLSTFVILGDAPLLAGPQDEADRALAFFVRRTAISLGLLAALFVLRRLTRLRKPETPKDAGPPLDWP